ncbi:hypothetical protein VTO73DRAFT_9936 [Trametes versicolor]
MASTEPAPDDCLLVPLKAPPFYGTLEEYLSTCAADHMRHARVGLSPMAPLGYSRVADDAPLSVKPPTVARSRPMPAIPVDDSSRARKKGNVVQASIPRLSDRRKEIKQLFDSNITRLSAAGLGLARIVEPMKAEVHRRTGTATRMAGLQRAHKAQDALSLMPLFPAFIAKLYTIRTELDLSFHPHHPDTIFRLGIDTASLSSWTYGSDFQQIPSLLAQRLGYLELEEDEEDDGDDDQDEGENEGEDADEQEQQQKQEQEEDEEESEPDTVPWHVKQVTAHISGINTVIPVDVDGEEVPFPTSGAPQGPNEWSAYYGDGSAVYLRHIPDSSITAHFPCWSWKNNDQATCRLALQSVLAFGANHAIISLPPVDGLIGLGVPNVRPLAYHTGTVSERTQFFDALETPFPRVYEPRRFLIKLNYPEDVDECEENGAIDFMYMGIRFPCILKPVFTPKLAVYAAETPGSPCDRMWMLGMRAMSLLVPDGNNGFSEFKINMVNPNNESVKAYPVFANMIHVLLDTGTSKTYLPKDVHDEIRDSWLGNSQAILNLQANRKIQSYCGPERNLDDCEVVFTFIGQDGGSVDFRCPAKPFLKSYFPLPSHGQETPPSRYCSTVMHWSPGMDEMTGEVTIADSKRNYWVLGSNFYWSAFVEHVGPIKDERVPEADFSHYSEPYSLPVSSTTASP